MSKGCNQKEKTCTMVHSVWERCFHASFFFFFFEEILFVFMRVCVGFLRLCENGRTVITSCTLLQTTSFCFKSHYNALVSFCDFFFFSSPLSSCVAVVTKTLQCYQRFVEFFINTQIIVISTVSTMNAGLWACPFVPSLLFNRLYFEKKRGVSRQQRVFSHIYLLQPWFCSNLPVLSPRWR